MTINVFIYRLRRTKHKRLSEQGSFFFIQLCSLQNNPPSALRGSLCKMLVKFNGGGFQKQKFIYTTSTEPSSSELSTASISSRWEACEASCLVKSSISGGVPIFKDLQISRLSKDPIYIYIYS